MTTIAMFMPTLNASSSACETPWPRKRNSIRPCFVPAPPGVAGKSVASESTTCASSALCRVAVHAERLQEEEERGDPEDPRDRLRHDHAAHEAAAVAEDREALRERERGTSHTRRARQDEADECRGRGGPRAR